MPVAFPSIKPTDREYLPPEHATSRLRAQNGVASRRLWGSKPTDAELTLGFQNISSDKGADIVQAWLDTKSGIDTLILPSVILSGTGARLAAIILPTTGSLSWTFAERPSITSVGPIWVTARVKLIGELRMS